MRCNPGYQFDTKTTEVRFSCSFEGEWIPADESNTEQFHCELAQCASPPVVKNVDLIDHAQVYRLHDSVHYACPPAMELANRSGLVAEVVCSLNTTSSTAHSNMSLSQTNTRKPIFTTSWNPNPLTIECIPVECRHPGIFFMSCLYDYNVKKN